MASIDEVEHWMQGIGGMNITWTYIGEGHPPFIIAEISANHNGLLDAAPALIDSQALRSRCRKTRLILQLSDLYSKKVILPEFQITEGPWAGRTASIYMMSAQYA